jgi:hypothetical protein
MFRAKCITAGFTSRPPPQVHADLTLTPVLALGNRSPLADSRMRGSFVGLALDSSLADLALKFNVTLEAIALQTRHIVDTLNAKGHSIQEICISGGQAKNAPLVQLLADVCGIPVILPGLDGGTSVVLGSAMLGRFAAEVTAELSSPASGGLKSIGSEAKYRHAGQTRQERAPVLPTQADVDRESSRFGPRLWHIMVRIAYCLHSPLLYFPTPQLPTALCPTTVQPPRRRRAAPRISVRAVLISSVRLTHRALHCQVEMTAVGRRVHPAASPVALRLLEAKYKIFLEAIDIQRRWRMQIEEASQK